MNFGLKGRVAIVAGASQGLGKAAALILGREGALVAICSRSAERLAAAASELASQGVEEVLPLACDVTKTADISKLVQAVLGRWGKIDILINNAGGPPAGLFESFTMDQWRAAVELNLLSTVGLCQSVAPHMRDRKWGRIVNITSIAAKEPVAGLILSNAARAGVLGFAKTLSNELAAEGITVNSVCPGYTRTERLIELARSTAARESIEIEAVYTRWEEAIPMKRLGEPEELAGLIAFLCSEQASYITGCAIQVDGGLLRSTI